MGGRIAQVQGRVLLALLVSAFAAMTALCFPFEAHAVDSGVSGTCAWELVGKQLVVRPENGASGVLEARASANDAPWKSIQSSVTSVKVEKGVSATSCAYLFAGLSNASSFDLSGLGTAGVADFSNMFLSCSKLRKTPFDSLDMGSATTVSGMFERCSSLVSADLSALNAPKLVDLSRMFQYCTELRDVKLAGMKTGAVENVDSMFNSCGRIEGLDLSGFDTSHVTNFNRFLANCSALENFDAGMIDISSAKTCAFMFASCSKLSNIDVTGWDTSHVVSFENAFSGCSAIKTLDMSNWDLSALESAKFMFEANDHLEYIDLSAFRNAHKLNDVYAMFNQCPNLRSVNLRNMDFAHVESFAHFLEGCMSLKSVDMSGVKATDAISTMSMFKYSTNLEKVSFKGARFDNSTSFEELFTGCEKLKSVDFTNVYAPKINNIMAMFASCTSLESIDFTGATFGTVFFGNDVFLNCRSLDKLDLSCFKSQRASFLSVFDGAYVNSYTPMQGYAGAGPKKHPSISKASFKKIANRKYTGGYITPKVTLSVKDGSTYAWGDLWGKALTQGKHYTVRYSGNKKVGTAKITIKGKGIFKGTMTKTFKIVAK